jgi:hypothetical protein
MATKPNVNERVAVLETKLDDIKEDVTTMRKENREDHDKVMTKLEALEGYRNWLMGAVAIISPALIIAANHYFK